MAGVATANVLTDDERSTLESWVRNPTLVFAVLWLVLAACGFPSTPTPDIGATGLSQRPASVPAGIPAGAEPAEVIHVVDGDTIDVVTARGRFRVRYIGVDTPETVHPTRGVEPFGREASEANRALVEGQSVYLEKDVSETDNYGRLLRYVWLPDGSMVNAELVALGYAQVSTFPPDVKYAHDFLALEHQAREAALGLWAAQPETQAACDPAYPGMCIPSPPPDLDCGEIPYRNFRVLPPDPHRFDGDRDGVGCEITSFSPASPSQGRIPTALPESPSRTCCKICTAGKPCGDTCIARNKTCRVGPGCAC